MANQPKKTKTLLLNPQEDSALVISDDGLWDFTDYEERRLLYDGDKQPTDYEPLTQDCD